MSFNPQEVFSSVQSFLGSGYVLLAVIALLGVSIIKKVLGILIAAGVILLLWIFCQDSIMGAIQGIANVVG